MRLLSLRRMLVFTAVLYWIVAAIWFITQPDLEPLTALLGALIGLIPLLGSRAASDAPISDALKYSPTPKQRNRNREAMLQLVKNTWVKGVLEQSLHGAVMIELGLEYQAGAVERPWDMVLQAVGQQNHTLPHGTKIINVFDEVNRALLILGEPGSGKTTMLLELARDLIARTEWDDGQPMPVVFNLSSWVEKQKPIADWLADELNSKYDIPKKIAGHWVENDDLTLLLDGLDEVKLERRDACVQAINDFRKEHGLAPLVVCSRTGDYGVLSTSLRLHGAVVLQPLTPKQINEYLAGAGVELLAVRKTLGHDTTLWELVQSPLILSIMSLVYRGMSVEDLGTLDTTEARRRLVFDKYIQWMFQRRRNDKRYSPEQSVHWLTWLAQRMIEHAQSVFLIERIQPSWLQTRRQGCVYLSILGLSMVPFGMAFVPGGVSFGKIAPAEGLKWSPKRHSGQLTIALGVGIGFGLLFGLLSALQYGPSVGLRVGLSLGLSVGLMSVLVSGLTNAEIETKTTPNQGIWRSGRNSVLIALIIWLIFGGAWLALSNGFDRKLTIVPVSGLVFGSTFGIFYGGAAFIQHFMIRIILYWNNCIPWNYARFLDYAADLIFLRKVGGGYIFIHRLLMEYFAELEA
jgi:DNA polymerase III delta prime subunit